MIESSEVRWLCSVSVNAAGYTIVSPDVSSKIVYVSQSSGSDQNSGLSAGNAVASLGRAEALVRDHSADQILLKSGDTWSAGFDSWTKSGVNAQHPILIGTYGTGSRPLILTGDVPSAFSTTGNSAISNLVITGLQFRSDVRDPASSDFSANAGHHQDSGFRWYAPTSGFLLQDCSFQYYSDNLDIEGLNGPISGVSVFRCESLDSYTTSGGAYRSQGLYGYNLNGISITQSLFDHDGWSETIPNASRSGYDHDIYLSSTVVNASIQDNVIANASNNGLLARGGGDIENNFFLDNPSAISYGASPGSMSAAGGVRGAIIDNIIMGDAGIGGESFGYGITIANTAPGTPTRVANNIFTGDTQQSKPAIELTAVSTTDNPADCVGINDLVLQNNLFDNWYRPLAIDSILQPRSTGLTALTNVSIQNNNFQNAGDYLVRYDSAFSDSAIKLSFNTYTDSRSGDWFELNGSVLDFPEWKSKVEATAVNRVARYPDGTATQASYVATIGDGSTSADFLSDERSQSSTNWNAAYSAGALNDYLRNAFGVPTTPVAVATAEAVNTLDANTFPASSSSLVEGQYTFSVNYSDTQSLDVSNIASGNVSVTGPNDFSQSATLVSVSPSADGKSAVAIYAITPPGGNWNGVADGTYTVNMEPDQIRNRAGIAVAQGSIGTFDVSLPLIVDGTSGNDQISARVAKGRLIVTVNRVVTSYPAADVPQLQIEAGDGNDRISIAAHVVPSLVDGGAGNDVIQTSNGNDTLLGSEGNDILKATGGHNLLLGGAGNDQLISGTGPNLLDGGDGNDRLHGGSGDDVLIGGTGSDRLQAGRGNQLLLAAVPNTEDSDALIRVSNSWANGQPYAARVAALAPPTGTIVSGETLSLADTLFQIDSSADTLIGGPKADWFVDSSTDDLIHKTVAEVNTSYE